ALPGGIPAAGLPAVHAATPDRTAGARGRAGSVHLCPCREAGDRALVDIRRRLDLRLARLADGLDPLERDRPPVRVDADARGGRRDRLTARRAEPTAPLGACYAKAKVATTSLKLTRSAASWP